VALASSYRRRIRERALDRDGYVPTRDAEELEVPVVGHAAYSLCRFDDIPRTSRDQFVEAVLRVGPKAFLTHDPVLARHDLGLVNPRRRQWWIYS
jgi:hypothetical protein